MPAHCSPSQVRLPAFHVRACVGSSETTNTVLEPTFVRLSRRFVPERRAPAPTARADVPTHTSPATGKHTGHAPHDVPSIATSTSQDSGVLDDLPLASAASSVGLGDPDAPATFDDFVAAFARAVSLRTAHIAGGGARAPAPPRRASARRLRDIFLSACVDFDGAKKRSNANTLALPRWRRLCVGSGFVARKFPAAAADVVFAKTRRAGERELRAEDFASALARVAAETGRTFECVVDAAAKCAAGGCLSAGVAAARVAASARREPRRPRDGVHASLDDRALLRIRPHSKPRSKPVVSVRESFPPARPAPTAAPEPESRLDAALSCPRAEDFDAGDVDGDGLLSPAELAGVLMRSCHADEADAVHLTRVCFEDVDLDKDGRVSFEEYRAFCKKAKRVLRRRALAARATREDVQKSAGVRRLTFGTGFGSSCARWVPPGPRARVSIEASTRFVTTGSARRAHHLFRGRFREPRAETRRAARARRRRVPGSARWTSRLRTREVWNSRWTRRVFSTTGT